MLGQLVENDQGNFYTDPVIGYRTWAMHPTELVLTGCIYSNFHWDWQHDAVGKCLRSKIITEHKTQLPHDPRVVPVKDCQCGFYAYTDYETLQNKSGLSMPINKIRGVCIGWGKVWTAEHGWRAKFARPVALLHWKDRRAAPTARTFNEEKDQEAYEHWTQVSYRIAEKYDLAIVDSPIGLDDAVRQYLQ